MLLRVNGKLPKKCFQSLLHRSIIIYGKTYCNSLFFRLKKKIPHKIIFGQTKLNENNFTSRVRWALIEEIAPHAEEMAGEKEIACCVRGHVYLDIRAAAIREVLVYSTEPTNVGRCKIIFA